MVKHGTLETEPLEMELKDDAVYTAHVVPTLMLEKVKEEL